MSLSLSAVLLLDTRQYTSYSSTHQIVFSFVRNPHLTKIAKKAAEGASKRQNVVPTVTSNTPTTQESNMTVGVCKVQWCLLNQELFKGDEPHVNLICVLLRLRKFSVAAAVWRYNKCSIRCMFGMKTLSTISSFRHLRVN